MGPATAPSGHQANTNFVSISGSWVATAHTVIGLGSFLSALATGLWLHYHKIVKNEWYGYPEEWWPSVSATIGDWYPERNIFQILMVFTSGPRLSLIFLSYFLNRTPNSSLPGIVALCGVLRTFACAGWVYITSSDDHDFHDVAMISYLVLTVPWQLGTIATASPACMTGNPGRKRFTCLFFGSLVPLIYLYIQHKVKRVPGAYTYYSFIEWSLIFYDVLYDSCFALDFARLRLQIVDVAAVSPASGSVDGWRASPKDVQVREKERVWLAAERYAAWVDLASFVADVYMGFVYWSTLTALGPVIFYFSVWSMGLDGQEVLLFATLSPILLAIPPVRRLAIRHTYVLHLLSLVGIASYLIDRQLFYDDAVYRLQAVAFAVAASTLALATELHSSSKHPELFERKVAAFGLGWLASVVVKYANQSLNPVWPILRANNGGWNTIGLALALLAWAQTTFHPTAGRVPRGAPPASPTRTGRLSWLTSSFSLGALLFLIHTLFTDSGTIIAWTWEGYPIRGPVPVPHGALTILSLCAGLLASILVPDLVQSPLWTAAGCAGAAVLYAGSGWAGFAGGALLGAFAASQLGPRLRAATVTVHSPALCFGLAYLWYDLAELAHTFTVAYAFVPGGVHFRERTDVVLAVTMASIALGSLSDASRSRISLGAWEGTERVKRWVVNGLAALAVLSVVIGMKRLPKHAPVPYNPEMRAFRAGIWTVHFGVDSGMWDSQRRMRDIIHELELDIVGLLESDLQRIVLGNRDLTQFIAEDLGMYVDLGPGPQKHTWGAALLSKFPILNSTHHLLPSPHGELAPAIHATLDIYGTLVDVVVSHNGQEQDPLDRQLQSQELGRIMAEAYPRPLVFLGYVVTRPHAEKPAPYKYLVEDGRMLDIEPADMDRWCEYVLFRGLRRTAYARINRGSKPAITDTEIQMGAFQIPDAPVDPDKDPSAYWTKGEDQVEPRLRMPAQLKGEGQRGHFYIALAPQFEGIKDVIYYV